ncbi:bifunctional protein-serine/threonine kinase/phosphatase [Noviherbaspirillum sp. Root189]|uniref:bifunctional protein-serine/threonine kinase/phosphatase n=1 Tax=Noviherbaspirillum sp. Root189 TaxID=1736487 RepID=UPI00070943FA|nr:bifunctional protein-serine/threonine kinase/phosphatase [Noviherbaspirillum sp. Root189]KRB67811.1 protein kinase [Noviherbaspirillum sp. Root189]
MISQLNISIGQHSDKGRKEINQDFHGAYVPNEPLLMTKGVALAIADGISSSDVSQVASQSAVTGFLEDYYCTSDAWSVKTSIERVLVATNSWLHAQTQQSQYRYDKDRGYVCTLSALVIKSTTAHIFHIGDSRIYHVRGNATDLLTNDHRIWMSAEQSYLGRALGVHQQIEIDYRTLQVEQDDLFLLATDGVYEHVDAGFIMATVNDNRDNLDQAAKVIVQEAYRRGSKDNLTIQIARIDALPAPDAYEMYQQLAELPLPPLLEPRMAFDGFRIVREMHASSRSHVYLAIDDETGTEVSIKTPSVDLSGDPAYLERFLMEEWIARRINSAHVLKPCLPNRKRNYLYVVTEFINGQTLSQWMIDNPKPDLDTVRRIIEQIAKGLRAFHRLEMLHQDLRPANIMIDTTGTVKIIDFGSTKVAGITEMTASSGPPELLGTAPYTAPEYFLEEDGSSRSDQFSLGVIAYHMLTGGLPYGTQVAKARTHSSQNKLVYQSVLEHRRDIPLWVDEAVRKAVHPKPHKRYDDLSEFMFDLHHPNKAFLNKTRPPLIERNPVVFWKGVSFILMLVVLLLLGYPSIPR